ncbi:aminotransferase class V-fold PLP-dependent enzyme [Arthrobacter sp. 2RAF6]|uniref:aminotransferase class V-fold PLP-dependent enzyme n=1 Tax=Arthrobacter sp. 2RAF6 TaxID=3233002 RepID=UPI003F8E970B
MPNDSRAAGNRPAFPPRETAYLDNASIGPVPTAVREAVEEVLLNLGQGTVGFRRAHRLASTAPQLIAAEWQVAESQIEFMSSAGEALNATARALGLGPGSTVLVEKGDFPQSILPFQALKGVIVEQVQRVAGGNRTEAILDEIRPGTEVVSVTHVHADTGEAVDLERLAAACDDVDALLVVDGSQAAGALAVDASWADVYVATGYKWQLAGFGIAAVARSKCFDERAVNGLRGYNNTSGGLSTGHLNISGAASLAAGALVRREVGLGETYRAIAERRSRISAAVRGYGLTDVIEGAGILSIGASDPETIVAALAERGVVVAARAGRVRISPSFMTADEELDKLIGTIRTHIEEFGISEGSFA